MKAREYIIKQDEYGSYHLFNIGDEVVRCKNCIDWDKDGFCGITGREEPESHYCSYGERREESEVEE